MQINPQIILFSRFQIPPTSWVLGSKMLVERQKEETKYRWLLWLCDHIVNTQLPTRIHRTKGKKSVHPIGLHATLLLYEYQCVTSSKTTLTDYQCVSTGCCIHVAKTEITIDNQHVTNIGTKVYISPQTTKRKHGKNHILATFS